MTDRRSWDLNYSRGRRGRPWRRYREHVLATETHCRRCGRLVDKTLPYRDPFTGKVNRWYATVGHQHELDAGGHPYQGGLEHLRCNSSAGATYVNRKRGHTSTRRQETPGVDTSADWT